MFEDREMRVHAEAAHGDEVSKVTARNLLGEERAAGP